MKRLYILFIMTLVIHSAWAQTDGYNPPNPADPGTTYDPNNPADPGEEYNPDSPADPNELHKEEGDVDLALTDLRDKLVAEQATLDEKKARIDETYSGGAAKYDSLVQLFAAIKQEAEPYANKFAADTTAIGIQLAALKTPIDAYGQFPERNFTDEIEALYTERALLTQQERLETEMGAASAELDMLLDSVNALVEAIERVEADMTALQTAIANAPVTPVNGVATVIDPMGGLDAILQNKEAVRKLMVTGLMEGNDFAALQKVENVEELTLPAVNSKTDSIRLGSLSSLLVVNLEDANTVLGDEVFTGCNPNLMVYAVKGAEIGVLNCNVILSGEAEEVVLTDGYPVRIPDAFSAQRISYTRPFSKKTYIGQSAGWESITLPFDVEFITTGDNRAIVPFGNQDDKAEHFWLAQRSGNTFKVATAILANVPYIISMPNNEVYTEGNITGNITFSGTDVNVDPTVNILTTEDFTPTYEPQDRADIYTINHEAYQAYLPGSAFVRGLRSAQPFEAYLTLPAGTKRRDIIPIFESEATGMDDVRWSVYDLPCSPEYYDLSGRKVKSPQHGLYIVNGRKVFVK